MPHCGYDPHRSSPRPSLQAAALATSSRGMSPPGLLATRVAGRVVAPAGRDAWPSRTNIRHHAAAQLPTAQPFVLDGLPGTTPRRPRSVAGEGRAFGACCFAGKLRSPAGPALATLGRGGLTPTSFPTSTPTSFPTRRSGVPLGSVVQCICPAQSPSWGQSAAKTAADWPPSGGVERPRRMVRFARLIQRHGRDLGGPTARAASGGNPSLPWLPPRVVRPGRRPSTSHQRHDRP
jgi:hypothetical protein